MTFYKTPMLETARLILRPVRLEDADAAQPLFNDPGVQCYLDAKSIPQPYPADGVGQYYLDYLLPEMAAGRNMAWAIIEKVSSDLIGVFQLSPEDEKDSRGFWLGSIFHSKGYITECIVATTDYAFDVLRMPRMLLNNAMPNIPSRRVKESANAELVSVTPDQHFVGGVFDKEQWRLTPERWRDSPMKHAAANPSYKLIS